MHSGHSRSHSSRGRCDTSATDTVGARDHVRCSWCGFALLQHHIVKESCLIQLHQHVKCKVLNIVCARIQSLPHWRSDIGRGGYAKHNQLCLHIGNRLNVACDCVHIVRRAGGNVLIHNGDAHHPREDVNLSAADLCNTHSTRPSQHLHRRGSDRSRRYHHVEYSAGLVELQLHFEAKVSDIGGPGVRRHVLRRSSICKGRDIDAHGDGLGVGKRI